MSDEVQSTQQEQEIDLEHVARLIERATVNLPISQLVTPFEDVVDWFLTDAPAQESEERGYRLARERFAARWHAVAKRALSANPRLVSDRALHNPDFDPLSGSQPWGIELTRAFRAALAEVGELSEEAVDIIPETEHTRTHVRAVRTRDGFVLPVLSYVPLLESEWRTLLDNLSELIRLALLFEGAVAVWLIGGFYRDVEGRLTLHPQLAFPPPQPGTRVKPLHVLLGTAYEEQCPSLLPAVRAALEGQRHASDGLLARSTWHRVAVQLDIAVDDYILFDLAQLGDEEREVARKVMYLDQQPLQPHILTGQVHQVPRPWQRTSPAAEAHPFHDERPATRVLPPQAALQAAGQLSEAPAPGIYTAVDDLHEDAEHLRQKGMAFVETDPAIAQKYLLASTVLENTSVDVWLKLVELATSTKQEEAFRREAEKALRRQRRDG